MSNTHTQITVGGTTNESQWETISFISDLHKDVYGFRPRNNYSGWSDLDLQSFLDELTEYSNAVYAENEELAKLKEERKEKAIDKLLKCGAGDKETAIRWLEQAEVCF